MAYAGVGVEGILVAELDVEGLRLARAAADRELDDVGRRPSFRKKPGFYQARFGVTGR